MYTMHYYKCCYHIPQILPFNFYVLPHPSIAIFSFNLARPSAAPETEPTVPGMPGGCAGIHR